VNKQEKQMDEKYQKKVDELCAWTEQVTEQLENWANHQVRAQFKSLVGKIEELEKRIETLENAAAANASRTNELVREVSGNVEVVEPKNVYQRPSRGTAKCAGNCKCRQQGTYTEKLPYA